MNILTFDLEDWFHILDHPGTASPESWKGMESRVEANTDRILSLLDERKQRATWFCLGWIAEKYPALIKKISQNHDIACHSMNHQLLFEQGSEKMKPDLLKNIRILEDLCGKKIKAYRSPGFSFNHDTRWLIEILSAAGIEYDCSVFPLNRNHGGFKSFPIAKPCRIIYQGYEIKEFPMNKSSILGKEIVYSGGGYFRFLPYRFVSSLMNKSDYTMTYFHPRDFDPEQPVLEGLSAKRKFMSYVGLKHSLSKLNRLLNDYKFVTVEEAGAKTDWNKTPLVNLENY